MHFSLLKMALLFVAAFMGGLFDALAGGGGIITLPALLMAGLPPTLALGTNRFQSCVGELTSSLNFILRGAVQLKNLWQGLVCAAIGSSLGTICIQHIHMELLQKAVPFFLLAILLYVIFSPRVGQTTERFPRISQATFYGLLGVSIGFYNGFWGPATGSFWIVAYVFFLGFNLQKAVMYAKPVNFMGNFISLLWFIAVGQIWYPLALLMGVAQVLGATLGARMVIKRGVGLIRPIFIGVSLIMTIDIFIKSYY